MSYTALYRKFRPDCFDEVKGQEHIVTTLKNQLKADRIGHAYLFCGTRGTGKTSVAKLFARAVNCEHPKDGSPCGECVSCRSIAAGASMNVIEIDAASNNGVDNIREIVEEVSYSPAEGRFKVYIIDEVHMLSIGAFNALLKTLEEPPEYVIFILATTEVHKIPITILSRCQRYDFKRLTIDTIAYRLAELTEKEQVEVEPRALKYIAKTADGSMRDALSLLDQCIAFHFGKKLTYDMALDVLGAVDTEVFGRLFRMILNEDVLGSIKLLEEVVMQGRELTQFVSDYTWYLRNLMLAKTSGQIEDVIDVSTDNLARLKEEAGLTDLDAILRYIRIFSELSGQIRYAAQKRILIEMAVIKLCRPAMESDNASLAQRIRDLEDGMARGQFLPAAGGFAGADAAQGGALPGKGIPAGEGNRAASSSETASVLEQAIPEDIRRLVGQWKHVVEQTAMPMKLYLRNAKLSLDGDNRLLVVLADGLAADYFLKHPENKEQLDLLLSGTAGKQVETIIRSLDSGKAFEDTYIDLSSMVHMEVEIEEEGMEE